jgi:hypothetical protein
MHPFRFYAQFVISHFINRLNRIGYYMYHCFIIWNYAPFLQNVCACFVWFIK